MAIEKKSRINEIDEETKENLEVLIVLKL